jgi:hypothetical protein
MFQTEVEFTLPFGYIDAQGDMHRHGIMRLARAEDEIDTLQENRVQQNPAYWSISLLGRVVIRLGTLETLGTPVIEKLFAPDFTYLQELYLRLNAPQKSVIETYCPHCGTAFCVDLNESANLT